MNDMLANVFLGCFLFGFIFSTISLIFGAGSGHHFHLPFGGHDAGGGGVHVGGGHDTGSFHGHGGVDAHGHGGADAHGGSDGGQVRAPFFSFNGILIFITFFGGVGYILHHGSSATILLTLLGAIAAGFFAAGVVFLFLNQLLLRGQTRMNPVDYFMPGTLGRVTSPIRGGGGVGEVCYVQGGARKTTGARSDDNLAHSLGEEVVIVRYEKGIAFVKSVETVLE